MNEGLAEYTGVRLGNPQPGEAQAAALRDLNNQAKVPSLVRSFAYATGPRSSSGLMPTGLAHRFTIRPNPP